MKSFSALLAAGFAAVAADANATTLSGTLSVDNLFTAYISTDDAVLGTTIATGADWTKAVSFGGVGLTPGLTHYLHVVGTNAGDVQMFIGKFTLSDTNFQFSNGGQTLLTDTLNWKADPFNKPGGPLPPAGTPLSFGFNSVCCTAWGGFDGLNGAQFIWANSPEWQAYFSAAITPLAPIETPLPAAFPLFATILAGGGLIRWVRKRKVVGAVCLPRATA